MKNVLLIAGLEERYYYDEFLASCTDEGINIFVLDPSRLPDRASINLSLDGSGTVVGFIDVLKHVDKELKDYCLSIEDIHVAWYLRENISDPNDKDTSLEIRFSQNESRHAFLSLLSVLQCKWVNRKEVISRVSSNKLYQQQIAIRSGLRVPRTVVSNDAESVIGFSGVEGGLLLKTLGYMDLDESGDSFIYSERFEHSEIIESSIAIHACPVFAQEYVEKRYEYRIMVLGSQILACRIDSQASPMTKTDWRHYDFDHVEHSPAILPLSVQENLLRFMNNIGLNYGAIDLIETLEGEYVFLEVNPCGQWGWIEHYAKLSIPSAVAKMIKDL
ncbi:MAG: hypothetical protein JWL88_496 [Parcubacteria group bacterium]|nr:hypothetical protein [Parcubacteria group bacterium]